MKVGQAIPIERSAKIYWLWDTRNGLPGKPFYCGMVCRRSLPRRLSDHRCEAAGGFGRKVLNERVEACDDQIRIQLMEELRIDGRVGLGIKRRLQYWIDTLRLFYPDECCNRNDALGERRKVKVLVEINKRYKKKKKYELRYDSHSRRQAGRFLALAKKTDNTLKKVRYKALAERWTEKARKWECGID